MKRISLMVLAAVAIALFVDYCPGPETIFFG